MSESFLFWCDFIIIHDFVLMGFHLVPLSVTPSLPHSTSRLTHGE